MCVCVCHLDSYTITQNHTERKAFRVNKSEHTAKDKKSHTVIGNTDKARERDRQTHSGRDTLTDI